MKWAILEGIAIGLIIGAIGCAMFILWVYSKHLSVWG